MEEVLRSHGILVALGIADEAGLIGAIHRAGSAPAPGTDSSWQSEALRASLRILVESGFLRLEGNSVLAGDRLPDRHSPHWGSLLFLTKAYAKPFGLARTEWLGRKEDFRGEVHGPSVGAASARLTRDFAPWFWTRAKASGWKSVLDLGCGDGSFLRELAEMPAQLTLRGVDTEAPASESSVEFLRADFLAPEARAWIAEADVIVANFVLHELAGERAEELRALFSSLAGKGTTLLAWEFCPDPPLADSGFPAASSYLLWHALTGQKSLAREEWTRFFRSSGARSVRAHELAGDAPAFPVFEVEF